MSTGIINGRFYENVPTPEEWGDLQAELSTLQAQNAALLAALEEIELVAGQYPQQSLGSPTFAAIVCKKARAAIAKTKETK